MCGRLWGDGDVVSFPGGVADGELDDLVEEAAALGDSQAIGLHDGSELAGAGGDRGQMLALGDNIIVKLGIEPAQLGQFDERVAPAVAAAVAAQARADGVARR